LIIIFTQKTKGWGKIMHPKIPETEQPVQGFFYAGGADHNRAFYLIETQKRKEVKEGLWIRNRKK
jgi:hypothetical protein